MSSLAVAAVRRSDQKYAELLSAREPVDCGCIHCNPSFPEAPYANFLCDVQTTGLILPTIERIESTFAARGARCYGWIPATGEPIDPLDRLVEPRGYAPRPVAAFIYPLTQPTPPADGRLSFVGARALRRTYRGLVESAATAREESAASVAAHLERLNDPQYDAWVARIDEQPVAIISLLQAGDIGRICDWFVVPEHRGRGIGAAILAYALTAARRWALRTICAACDARDAASTRALKRVGFEYGGEWVEYWRR